MLILLFILILNCILFLFLILLLIVILVSSFSVIVIFHFVYLFYFIFVLLFLLLRWRKGLGVVGLPLTIPLTPSSKEGRHNCNLKVTKCPEMQNSPVSIVRAPGEKDGGLLAARSPSLLPPLARNGDTIVTWRWQSVPTQRHKDTKTQRHKVSRNAELTGLDCAGARPIDEWRTWQVNKQRGCR